jgi:hypothetical protein
MKVTKVQSVLLNLSLIRRIEAILTDFCFYDNHGSLSKDDDVNSLPEPVEWELKKKAPTDGGGPSAQ